jgi:transaldolase
MVDRTAKHVTGATHPMIPVEGPLLQTARIGRTDYWNDSCAVEELRYAIARGATGATCNPPIVLEVLAKERSYWAPRIVELASADPTWSEADVARAVTEEMAVRGAAELGSVYERERGRKGWQSVQVDPADYRDADRMVAQAERFASLAPNIQVKFPVTAAGLDAIEEAVARGINVTATVSFTVAQAIASAEAIERGLERLSARGGDPSRIAPVAVLMIGRLDDWLKVVVDRDGVTIDPAALDWAGLAVIKRAYGIFMERRYRSRLLAAAYRHHLHWTELVGGDLAMTIPHRWQVRFNESGLRPVPRIDVPVDPRLLAALCERLPDFRRAYEPAGLSVAEFDAYGPTARTLRGFIQASHDLMAVVRDLVLPNPDRATA